MTNWYRGTDGLYHWVNCWFIGHCGFSELQHEHKTAEGLTVDQMCPVCLNHYFFEKVTIPGVIV